MYYVSFYRLLFETATDMKLAVNSSTTEECKLYMFGTLINWRNNIQNDFYVLVLVSTFLETNFMKFSKSKQSNIIDPLFILETKPDYSIPDVQFTVDIFNMWMAERTAAHDNGIILYISDMTLQMRVSVV